MAGVLANEGPLLRKANVAPIAAFITSVPKEGSSTRVLRKQMLKLRLDSMKCASTIKTNTKIVRKRLEVAREHIANKVKCAAKQNKTVKVLRGKMGNYKSTIHTLKKVRKTLKSRAKTMLKAKKNKLYQ